MGTDDSARKGASRQATPLVAIPVGVAFGVIMHRSGVTDPNNIVLQFTFQRLVMLKMFLAAGGMSAFVFAMYRFINSKNFSAASVDFNAGLVKKSYTQVALGAGVLGAGMAIAGGCPGMVLIQVGSGLHNSLYTIAGCAVGAFLGTEFAPASECKPDGKRGTYLFTGTAPSVALGLALVAISVAADTFRPWTMDVVEPTFVHEGFLGVGETFYISPVLAGVLVGALQLPVVALFSDTLGSATSYVHALSYACPTAAFESFRQPSFYNAWQLPYVIGAIGGGFLSASAANTFGTEVGLPPLQSFLGGVLMLYGSRIASGCTSGHGLSGLALGCSSSWVAVPAMFAGGIATAFAMKAAGVFYECTDNCAW